VSQVKVDEVLGLCAWLVGHVRVLVMNWRTVSHEAAKVPADDTMPRRALAAIKLHECQRGTGRTRDINTYLLLDVLGNVLATVSPPA
jgi:hypothetical protein